MNKKMSVPEVIQKPNIKPLYSLEIKNHVRFRYFNLLLKNRLDYSDKTRQDKQNGGFIQMIKLFKPDIQGLNGLSGDGLPPAQVYEICVPEGDYKEYLIQTIPRGHERYAIIYDRSFNNMKEFVEYIKVLRDFYNLLLLDVSELLYLDFIKDYNQLKRSIRQFYDHLGALAKLGTTSIVFTNFFYYYQIFNGIFKPETIQIHIYPSDVPPFWEAQFINPPEWNGRKSLFRPFKEEVPFLIQY